MRLLEHIRKPEYFIQPALLVARVTRSIGAGRRPVTAPWSLPLLIDPADEIGKALVRMGVYDLPVSETIWRLLDPGETGIDVGANVGYMTSIMAAKVGPRGSVVAFEPHPAVFRTLRDNIESWRKLGVVRVEAHRVALNDRSGAGALHVPEAFASNSGLASLEEREGGTHITVEMDQLDCYAKNIEAVGLLKVDVEGHELQVFRGSEALLGTQRLRDIVFEEFRDYPTPVTEFLERHGYEIYQLGMTFWGPLLSRGDGPAVKTRAWTARSMLATRNAHRARLRLAARGWRILRPKQNCK
jgi:FkbM family methyltransferase